MTKPRIILIAGIVLAIGASLFFVLNKKNLGGIPSLKSNNNEVTVGNDVCSEFPIEWVSNVSGKTIIKTEVTSGAITNVCRYYVDESNFLTLRLNNLSAENQKKGQQALGRTITTNNKIKMDHFVVVQEDGLINGVYLIINPNLFIAVDRSSTKAASEEEIINFAINVASRIQNGENVVSSKPVEKKEAVVPLPQEEDIVRSFFEIINEQRPSDAVLMLNPKLTADDSNKQAWAVQFNAFKSLKVKDIESSIQSDWTEGSHTYKVTLIAEMKPESANAVIPYYGWDNGENTRWVSLEKVGNKWTIGGLATGP